MAECLDSRGVEGWTCIEFDGTGLWCDACLSQSPESVATSREDEDG
jgi:hypothetical protein